MTAARAKAADAEKAASQASEKATQLAAEKAALQQKLDAVNAELAKKPGLNK